MFDALWAEGIGDRFGSGIVPVDVNGRDFLHQYSNRHIVQPAAIIVHFGLGIANGPDERRYHILLCSKLLAG